MMYPAWPSCQRQRTADHDISSSDASEYEDSEEDGEELAKDSDDPNTRSCRIIVTSLKKLMPSAKNLSQEIDA